MPKPNILTRLEHLRIAEEVIESDKRINASYQAKKRVFSLERLVATLFAALIVLGIIAFIL